MLVCIAGIDGAGKTTVTNLVVSALIEAGYDAIAVKIALFANPAYQHFTSTLDWLYEKDKVVFNKLRTSLINLQTIYTIVNEIQPALDAGKIVVCDRYVEGTLAYLQARQLPYADLQDLLNDLPKANIAFLLCLPTKIAVERLRNLNETISASQEIFLETVNQLLDTWAEAEGVHRVNATQGLPLLVENIKQEIIAQLHS